MSAGSAERGGERRFPSAFRGYDVEEVDRHLADLAARLDELAQENHGLAERVSVTEAEREEALREAAVLRGEFDAMRAALPEIEELHARLEELRGEYAERIRAVELLLAAAAREVGERLGLSGAWSGLPPESAAGVGRLATVDRERGRFDGSEEVPEPKQEAPLVGPDEAVRGSWTPPDAEARAGGRAGELSR